MEETFSFKLRKQLPSKFTQTREKSNLVVLVSFLLLKSISQNCPHSLSQLIEQYLGRPHLQHTSFPSLHCSHTNVVLNISQPVGLHLAKWLSQRQLWPLAQHQRSPTSAWVIMFLPLFSGRLCTVTTNRFTLWGKKAKTPALVLLLVTVPTGNVIELF